MHPKSSKDNFGPQFQSDGATEKYVGLTGPQFKKRLGNHKKSFKHEKYAHETTLSSHIWKLKEKILISKLNGSFWLGQSHSHQ